MHQILSRSVAGAGSLVSLVSVALMASAALPVRTASAATIHVMNCNDSGVGSLRGSVASALSGDTIDLTMLPCSRIVLTSGQIAVPQDNLTVKGPGRDKLTVDGNHTSRVLYHTGAGTLSVHSMSIADGYDSAQSSSPMGGGCILSTATVELNAVQVHHCQVISPGRGGGVNGYTVRVIYSRVFSNAILNYRGSNSGLGGGIWGFEVTVYRSDFFGNNAGFGGGIGGLWTTVSYSSIWNNHASSDGGGLYSQNALALNKSTVSANSALRWGGGVLTAGDIVGPSYVMLSDSTVSGNSALVGGGAAVNGGVWSTVANSTIAFNQEHPSSSDQCLGGLSAAPRLHMDSSIVARNTCNGVEDDINQHSPQVHGANNLVQQSTATLPADTIFADPLLAALANNGGPTQTHALLNGSPAIDRGNNFRHRLYDQRGPGFVRVKGTAPDIGAFEH